MKISMLSTLPPTKGLSHYTLGLVSELSNKCEVDFYGFKSLYPEFLYPGGTRTDENEPKLENINIKNYITWYNPLTWLRLGFSINTDIFHVQWWSWVLSPIYLTVLTIARLRKKKIIMTIHNVKPHEKSLIKNFLNISVIFLAKEYIVHSKHNKTQFLKVTKTKKKIHVVPLGVTIFKKSSLNKTELKAKYGFEDKDKVLLFFGTIRDYKGLDVLLQSLGELEDEDVKLIIAGKPWESFNNYNSLINKLKLSKRIKLFLDYNPNKRVAEIFKLSDLAVYPYIEFEASSAAASVALGFSKAIVVTDVGGLPDMVLDQKVIAKPNDSDDLKEKMCYALRNLIKLEKDSKQKASEFSWHKIAEKIIAVYEYGRII